MREESGSSSKGRGKKLRNTGGKNKRAREKRRRSGLFMFCIYLVHCGGKYGSERALPGFGRKNIFQGTKRMVIAGG